MILRPALKKHEETNVATSQHSAKTAILADGNFALTYLLTRVRSRQPYENYALPASLAEFEFDVKGLLRLEMMNAPGYRRERRLLGAMFNKKKTGEHFAWRSRVLYRALPSLAAARAYLAADPLFTWGMCANPDWLRAVPEDEATWMVLFIVHDVSLPGGRRLADVLTDFFSGVSQSLELVACTDILGVV